MGFFSVPITYKPKKLSKKQKQQLGEQRKVQRQVENERKNYWKTAPVYSLPKIEIPNRNPHAIIHSGPSIPPIEVEKVKPEYDEEMLERERKAKLVTEDLKKMTAPLFNKGGYQFIGSDPEIIKNLGKKV